MAKAGLDVLVVNAETARARKKYDVGGSTLTVSKVLCRDSQRRPHQRVVTREKISLLTEARTQFHRARPTPPLRHIPYCATSWTQPRG